VTPHLPIVGIGASAGGVEALEGFFRAAPAENGMAFVVVTHLPPHRDSLLAEILGRATRMPVVNARDDQPGRSAACLRSATRRGLDYA
jgi:two-component system, chemotaxis family, CheB/CheR fusion protein